MLAFYCTCLKSNLWEKLQECKISGREQECKISDHCGNYSWKVIDVEKMSGCTQGPENNPYFVSISIIQPIGNINSKINLKCY